MGNFLKAKKKVFCLRHAYIKSKNKKNQGRLTSPVKSINTFNLTSTRPYSSQALYRSVNLDYL